MPHTIEAIIHPDGTVELLEPIAGAGRRRALLTILDELPAADVDPAPQSDGARLDAALRAAGLLDEADDIPDNLEPLTEAERVALWAHIPAGTSLAQIVIDDREERY